MIVCLCADCKLEAVSITSIFRDCCMHTKPCNCGIYAVDKLFQCPKCKTVWCENGEVKK